MRLAVPMPRPAVGVSTFYCPSGGTRGEAHRGGSTMPRIVSPRVACGAAVLVLLILLSGGTRREPAAEASGPSWIDVTSDAVQTVYQGGVPHTDSAGNPRLTYDPTASFFPIGIYSPQPCKVTQELSLPSFQGH